MINDNFVFNAVNAANYLGISKALLYKLTASHRIPFYKPMGVKKLFFRKSDLDEWVESGRIITDAELKQKGGHA